jgi:hypothetical protein
VNRCRRGAGADAGHLEAGAPKPFGRLDHCKPLLIGDIGDPRRIPHAVGVAAMRRHPRRLGGRVGEDGGDLEESRV